MSKFRRGDIVSYPYLWRWQSAANPMRDHGEKDRPVCMILTRSAFAPFLVAGAARVIRT